MMLRRRRFLTICAAFAGYPMSSMAQQWQGRAFGADISIELHGPPDVATPALLRAQHELSRIEQLFSLYDRHSALSILNRTGLLSEPDPYFVDVVHASDAAWRSTEGLFDPTVQSLWRARAAGTAVDTWSGWKAVQVHRDRIELHSGAQLTFNGIAQGFATDRVADLLSEFGLETALVNIGEYRGLGGPWKLGIADPEHGVLGQRTLVGTAIATSSSSALTVGNGSHIMHAIAEPHWSTVSVEADTATVADSLSTALVLAPRAQIEVIVASRDDIKAVVLIDNAGNLQTI